ncbi:CPBP family intramembrane metalloprotease [Hymenobacter sp. BT188]|uniref:CPBP family intramembrane glutamic endopeptidase n=1 Tax=Hymenobacter sp. BT188 TaxID=2763504 RepID=UPI001651470E|nr:type II CAAX endopeptidase family protein [Hymenobacter sp. BT188]MBC6607742.1 CPBP family intramembrane metalloprotease [Hymenobacter sp. BT188]
MIESLPEFEIQTPINQSPAYPTISESWGALGWFMLLALVLGVLSIPFLRFTTHAQSIIVTVIASDLAKALIVVLLIWRIPAVRRHRLRLLAAREIPLVYWLLPLLVLAQMALRTLVIFLHLPNWMSDSMRKLSGFPGLSFFVICVSAPILEELLFRGLLLPGLLKNYSPRKAILQSSLLFGIIHLNPAQVVSAFLLGLFLGWLYYRTQSLAACIVVHFLNNAMAWIAMQNPKWKNLEDPIALLPEGSMLFLIMVISAVTFAGGTWLIWRATHMSIVTESEPLANA